jgi:hypothetical protein
MAAAKVYDEAKDADTSALVSDDDPIRRSGAGEMAEAGTQRTASVNDDANKAEACSSQIEERRPNAGDPRSVEQLSTGFALDRNPKHRRRAAA